MIYHIKLNRDRHIANVEANSEYEALYLFAHENMKHGENLGDNFHIIDEGDVLAYWYGEDEFSVDKILIWGNFKN